ncbi:MAG: nascent polypeptide-associated complex protein [Halobacteriota archaeon]
MRGGFRKGVGISPKMLNQMMKQTGINVKELDDVEEVVIKRADSELVFHDAIVTIMEAPGTTMYQITGTPEKRAKSEPPAGDVELVMEKAGCSEEEAKTALIEANGDLAEAIFKLGME